jgi:predicted nucleotidyltransferase
MKEDQNEASANREKNLAMHPAIIATKAELAQICTRYCVQRLELFGSAATKQFDPRESDIDFLVQFQALTPAEHANCYFGLREALETLFARTVDLVEAAPVRNPYFLAAIEPTRVVVYAA